MSKIFFLKFQPPPLKIPACAPANKDQISVIMWLKARWLVKWSKRSRDLMMWVMTDEPLLYFFSCPSCIHLFMFVYFLRQCVEPPVRFNFRWGRMKWIGACCCALVICSTERSRAFTLHISLKLSAAADHTNGLHSRLDHCMHCKRMHKL